MASRGGERGSVIKYIIRTSDFIGCPIGFGRMFFFFFFLLLLLLLLFSLFYFLNYVKMVQDIVLGCFAFILGPKAIAI